MSEEYIQLEVTEQQLASIISGLLFSCSVNIISESAASNEQYINEIYELAKKLKNIKPDIALEGIQFLEETHYEDNLSSDILREFEGNIKVITFEELESGK
jgi:hypothetical protein